MASKELNENIDLNVSIKTFGAIAAGLFMLIGVYFTLQADIAEAKLLPEQAPSDVSRMEYTLKDEMTRQAIFQTQKDLDEVKHSIDKINQKLDDMR